MRARRTPALRAGFAGRDVKPDLGWATVWGVADYGPADSLPLTVSGLRREVAWKRGNIVRGLAGKRLRLQVDLAGAAGKTPRLYALYLEPAR